MLEFARQDCHLFSCLSGTYTITCLCKCWLHLLIRIILGDFIFLVQGIEYFLIVVCDWLSFPSISYSTYVPLLMRCKDIKADTRELFFFSKSSWYLSHCCHWGEFSLWPKGSNNMFANMLFLCIVVSLLLIWVYNLLS